MTYVVMDKASANVIASFKTEDEAVAWVEASVWAMDEWGLLEIGPKDTDVRLVRTWPP